MKIVILDLLGLVYNGETLKFRGLGGSESAVILLSRELVKLGFSVTVFNNCIDKDTSGGVFDGVTYIDHSELDTYNDTPDLFISSRSVHPFWQGHKYSKIAYSAKKRVLWMHDTFCEGEQDLEAMIVGGFIDEVFTLSDFHTNYVLNCDHGSRRNFEVLKHKFWQTRNGAVCHIDEVDVKQKDPNHFVYNASATKGLIPLVTEIWPEIHKVLPNSHLTVIGGFYRFRDNAPPDAQELMVRKLQAQGIPGVKFTGVIPQFEIAKILSNASFTLYPTAFPETFGISTLESLLYRTPVITSRFGALEETAIDLACYKIDYSATPNSLFPNIDKESQKNNYIQTTLNAYHNKYLLAQKQQYCDIVKDIAGWDTVAKEWKQHIFKMLDYPLSLKEYRETKRIREKVNRIFGRRILNSESTKTYSSYSSQKKIVVISPFWNAENYIRDCIMSVASQDYDNYIHILIDDASTDNSLTIAKFTIDLLDDSIKDKFIIIENEINQGAVKNQIDAFSKFVHNDDIVILLDGDDRLIHNNSIFHYYNDLYDQGYDFTYGSTWSIADNIPLIAQTYPNRIVSDKSFRSYKFAWNVPYTHLRTFKGCLTKTLDIKKFKDYNGKWMKAGADTPLFYELIERANSPYAVKEIVHVYNDLNPLNDYKVRAEEQNRNAATSFNEKNINSNSN